MRDMIKMPYKRVGKFFLCAILVFLLASMIDTWMISPVKVGSSIIVDGEPNDWTGIPPIISDPIGDAPYDVGDIVKVYATHDETNLYFRIDVNGTISGTTGDYWVWLDTDQNVSTGVRPYGDSKPSVNIGADYLLNILAGKSFLRKRIRPNGNWKTTIVDLPEAWSGSVLETSVPLLAIDSPTGINIVVFGTVVDVYPEDTYVTYTVGANVANITVDGNPVDWGAISPVGTDAAGDAPDPSMDITDCYVVNDAAGQIFVRMDIFGVMDPFLDAIGFVDADANPDTGVLFPWGVGADGDYVYAENIGGTVLEAGQFNPYPNGITVRLFFSSRYLEQYDFAPDVGHVSYDLPSVQYDSRFYILLLVSLLVSVILVLIWLKGKKVGFSRQETSQAKHS